MSFKIKYVVLPVDIEAVQVVAILCCFAVRCLHHLRVLCPIRPIPDAPAAKPQSSDQINNLKGMGVALAYIKGDNNQHENIWKRD